MLTRNCGSLLLVKSALLDDVPGVWHAFTTRLGGVSVGGFSSLNLSLRVGDDPEAVRANRARLADAAGVNSTLVRLPTQMHGADVVEVEDDAPLDPLTGDGFVTRRVGVPVLVGVADCAPVLFAAGDGSIVAAAHAGWRGAVAGVVPNTVRMLSRLYGVAPTRLRAAIGPMIGPCCYEVGDEVADRFAPAHVIRDPGNCLRVDLRGALTAQLLGVGLRPEYIECADACTGCQTDLFFSHRASGGKTGRMVGMILRR